ncbi:LysR family transcriptional regulator [Roseibium sp. RKSG952]|uniref:LysR family transcriptional regulator n=1 Tax=Roseibium sp. RKSG952 TaxID=2529384 RepID=UPI0012BBDBD5|nr:LysR family transcriptional regulator [Roseibium sp. RKSG952]MTI02045.1 LysR family transcriptional regulator [Roseibium sp. RKSG952]
MAIKIEMLRCFCTVAQTGNIAEAAERLGRTQSAISMSLKQLEQHIGKPLFEGERKNRLTVLGEEVFKLALKQVRQFEHTINSIGEAANSEQGLVRIVSVPSVGALIFPAVLDILAARFPKLKVEIRDTDTQRVLDALAEGEADIGIASGHHPINGVEAIPLFEDRFGLVCAADHPLITQTAPPTIEDVVAAPFVRNALSDNIQTQAFVSAMEGAAIILHNTHSLIALVKTGKWVTILPQTVSRFMPETIAFRSVSDLPDKRQVYLYVHNRTRFREQTDACKSFILECIDDWRTE